MGKACFVHTLPRQRIQNAIMGGSRRKGVLYLYPALESCEGYNDVGAS